MDVNIYRKLEKAGIKGIEAMRFQLEHIDFFMRNNNRVIKKCEVE